MNCIVGVKEVGRGEHMRVRSHFEGTDACELMLILPQAGRLKYLSHSVHSGGRGGTPGAGSWEVAAFTLLGSLVV